MSQSKLSSALCAAVLLSATVPIQTQAADRRCMQAVYADCLANYESYGYSSIGACTQDQAEQWCPPEEGDPPRRWCFATDEGTVCFYY